MFFMKFHEIDANTQINMSFSIKVATDKKISLIISLILSLKSLKQRKS